MKEIKIIKANDVSFILEKREKEIMEIVADAYV